MWVGGWQRVTPAGLAAMEGWVLQVKGRLRVGLCWWGVCRLAAIDRFWIILNKQPRDYPSCVVES